MTSHADIFARLAAPFRDTVEPEVKVRVQAGKRMQYITARTAMNRLDEVLGPENWWDDYQPLETCVICRLSIRLPDGQRVTKCDAGGAAGMADAGDDDKSAFSDAFKRAAVKFGVGRYLYQDGTANFARDAKPDVPATKPATKPTPPASEAAEKLYSFVKRNNLLGMLRAIQSELGYPNLVRDWTPEQVRTAFTRLPTATARAERNGVA